MRLSEEERTLFRAARGRCHLPDYRDRLLASGSAPFACRSGSRYLYVDEHGDVCWCAHTRDVFSRPLVDYASRDLVRQFHTPKACADRCTVGCARTCSQLDRWRPQ